MNTVNKIKEACRKANPDKTWNWGCECDRTYKDPFTLADVLLAINLLDVIHWNGARYELGEFRVSAEGYFMLKERNPVRWNLKDNNLENQSPETIDFIHGLLHD